MSYNLTNRQKELLRKLVNGIRNEGWGETFFNMSSISDSVLVTDGAEIPIDSMKDMDILISEGLIHYDYSDTSYTITQTAHEAVNNDFIISLETISTGDTNIAVQVVGNIEGSEIQTIGTADNVQIQKVIVEPKNKNIRNIAAIITTLVIILTFLFEYIIPIKGPSTPTPTKTSTDTTNQPTSPTTLFTNTAPPEETLSASLTITLSPEENIKNVIRDYFSLLSNDDIALAWDTHLTANIQQSIYATTGRDWYENYWEQREIEIVRFGSCNFNFDKTECIIDIEVNYLIDDFPNTFIDTFCLTENQEEMKWLINCFIEKEITN